MKWPEIDSRELLEEMERRLDITEEIDDVRMGSLGAHPSKSFYSQKELKIDLAGMRAKFNKVA